MWCRYLSLNHQLQSCLYPNKKSFRPCAPCRISKRQIGLISVASLALSAFSKPNGSLGRIQTDELLTREFPRHQMLEEANLASYLRRKKDSSGEEEVDVPAEAKQIMALMSDAELATLSGEYEKATKSYETIIKSFPDLAVTEYARVKYALMLYQNGKTSKAILELDDEEVAIRGDPEVHSALAAILYSERPLQISRSEEQWDLAMSFDKRYSNPDWVASQKKWPPKMMQALRKFLSLQ